MEHARIWINLSKALVTAVVVIMLTELLVRAGVARVTFANSYDESRNPNYRRAWYAYTEPRPRDPDELLVILISNSQGFATEYSDGDVCYANQLETLLNESAGDKQVTVANWSIGGGSGPEMLVLAARAVDHNPDLLLLITHGMTFSYKRLENPLSFYVSDINQMAYHQDIRSRLPGWFIRTHKVYNPTNFLEANTGLLTFRNIYAEQRLRRWDLRDRDDPLEDEPQHGRKFNAREVRESGEKELQGCVDVFQKDQPDAPVIVVSMPLCKPMLTAKSWPNMQTLGTRMKEIFRDRPNVTVLDAIEQIDNDLFLSHAHFNEKGHKAFARYLLPYVAEHLGLQGSKKQATE